MLITLPRHNIHDGNHHHHHYQILELPHHEFDHLLLKRQHYEHKKSLIHKNHKPRHLLGSGVIFLNKRPAKYSVINDLNGEITNLFQCVQNDFDALAKRLEWFVCSRQLFFELASIAPESLSKVERAARFLFLQRCVMYGEKENG